MVPGWTVLGRAVYEAVTAIGPAPTFGHPFPRRDLLAGCAPANREGIHAFRSALHQLARAHSISFALRAQRLRCSDGGHDDRYAHLRRALDARDPRRAGRRSRVPR